MCDSPIYIKNPNRFIEKKYRDSLSYKYPWKDLTSERIPVPCGHCKTCIRMKQDGIVQRVQFESQKNHLFMCTLTYCNEMLPFEKVGDYYIRYADTSDVRNMFKRLRLNNGFGIPFRYLAVSELGSKRGRPHFHILFLFPKKYFPTDKDAYISACESFASKSQHYFTVLNEWKRNVSSSKKFPVWKELTHYVEKFYNGQIRKNYDFHYVNPFITENGVEDCGMYVLKYMFKPSDRAVALKTALYNNLDYSQFKDVWEKVRPRYFSSIGFGYNASVQLKTGKFDKDPDIVDSLKKDISVSKECLEYPVHFHPYTGKASMISPYYLKNGDIYSNDDALYFWKLHKKIPGDMTLQEEESQSDYLRKSTIQKKVIDHCDSLGIDSDFEFLDDD